jgi:hypothetical protein
MPLNRLAGATDKQLQLACCRCGRTATDRRIEALDTAFVRLRDELTTHSRLGAGHIDPGHARLQSWTRFTNRRLQLAGARQDRDRHVGRRRYQPPVWNPSGSRFSNVLFRLGTQVSRDDLEPKPDQPCADRQPMRRVHRPCGRGRGCDRGR